jgi:hypothetical protein
MEFVKAENTGVGFSILDSGFSISGPGSESEAAGATQSRIENQKSKIQGG